MLDPAALSSSDHRPGSFHIHLPVGFKRVLESFLHNMNSCGKVNDGVRPSEHPLYGISVRETVVMMSLYARKSSSHR